MVHKAAEDGFGNEALQYQEARPGYHPLLVERFVDKYGAGRVLEIGAGTGIFTGHLVEHGLQVLAVEPVDAMRQILAAQVPTAEVMSGTAEALPVEPETIDRQRPADNRRRHCGSSVIDQLHRSAPNGRKGQGREGDSRSPERNRRADSIPLPRGIASLEEGHLVQGPPPGVRVHWYVRVLHVACWFLVLQGECALDGGRVFDHTVWPFHNERDSIGIPIHLEAFAVGVSVMKTAERSEVA